MQFKVRALSRDQRIIQLSIDASDEADVRRQIESRGLFAIAISRSGNTLKSSFTFKRSSTNFSLLLFSQELLALLKAGLSIVESLEALQEKESVSSTRDVFDRLLKNLREGKRFSAALADQPHLFPPLYIGIVQAAEGTSNLPSSLTRFIDYQQRIDSIRSKVISAAIYPAILLLVGGAVSFFLIGYVVPRFAEVYQGAGRNLPWLSQKLLDWGRFAATHTRTILVSLALIVLLLFFLLQRFLAQGGLSRFFSQLPGVGEKVKTYELSRLYLTLGMLLEGGIPIVRAMDTVKSLLSLNIRNNLTLAQDSIQTGTPFSTAFETHQLTTPISVRMLRVGERTGELGAMLTQSAAFYDGEITRWIDRFSRMFEPFLMTAIGLIVGIIVVLLYMPIFDLAESLS